MSTNDSIYRKLIKTAEDNYISALADPGKNKFSLFGVQVNVDLSAQEAKNMSMRASVTTAADCLFTNTNNPYYKAFNKILNKNFDEIDKEVLDEYNKLEDYFTNITDIHADGINSIINALLNSFSQNPNTEDISEIAENVITPKNYNYEKLCSIKNTLPLFAYFKSYLKDQKSLFKKQQEDAKNNSVSRDDVPNIFRGHTFGGIIAAGIGNFIVKEMFSSDDDNSNAVYQEDISFLLTNEAESEFCKELIVADFLYLLYSMIEAVSKESKENYDIENNPAEALDDLFDSFSKAYKYYILAVAKNLKIKYLPYLKGITKQDKELSALKLMEKAILRFPYLKYFYKKYFDIGGIATANLKYYASLHMVDISEFFPDEKKKASKSETSARATVIIDTDSSDSKQNIEKIKISNEDSTASDSSLSDFEKRLAEAKRLKAEREKQEELEREKARKKAEAESLIQEEQRIALQKKLEAEAAERKRIREEQRIKREAERKEKEALEEAERIALQEKLAAEAAERERIREEERIKKEAEKREREAFEEAERERIKEERERQLEKDKQLIIEKAKEEQKRKEMQRAKAAELFSSSFDSELIAQYPKLFYKLEENPAYIENCTKHFKSRYDIAEAVIEYLDTKYKNVYTYITTPIMVDFPKKSKIPIKQYGINIVNSDNIIMILDETLRGTAKEGFVLTDKHFCYKNIFEKPKIIPISNIKSVSFDKNNIYINGDMIQAGICRIPKNELSSFLIFIFCCLLQLNSDNLTPNTQTSSQPENNSTIPQSWTCSCGNENPISAKFCMECGSKKPEPVKDWICTACETQNPAKSKFCMECGKAK